MGAKMKFKVNAAHTLQCQKCRSIQYVHNEDQRTEALKKRCTRQQGDTVCNGNFTEIQENFALKLVPLSEIHEICEGTKIQMEGISPEKESLYHAIVEYPSQSPVSLSTRAGLLPELILFHKETQQMGVDHFKIGTQLHAESATPEIARNYNLFTHAYLRRN